MGHGLPPETEVMTDIAQMVKISEVVRTATDNFGEGENFVVEDLRRIIFE